MARIFVSLCVSVGEKRRSMPAKIRTEKISAGWMEPISHSAKAAKNAAVIRVIPGFWNEIIFVIRWESSWKAMNDFDLYMDSV